MSSEVSARDCAVDTERYLPYVAILISHRMQRTIVRRMRRKCDSARAIGLRRPTSQPKHISTIDQRKKHESKSMECVTVVLDIYMIYIHRGNNSQCLC